MNRKERNVWITKILIQRMRGRKLKKKYSMIINNDKIMERL